MSRSIKRAPVVGNARVRSEKQDKVQAHQTLRAHFRVTPRLEDEDVVFDERNKAHSNTWAMAKDGKHRLSSPAKATADGKLRQGGQPADRCAYRWQGK